MLIDFVSLAVVLLGGIFGYRSGFFRQLARLAALVVGFLAARTVAAPVGEFVSRGLDITPFLANTVAFIGVFFFVSLAVSAIAGSLMGRTDTPGIALTFLNRGFGWVLGSAKAGLLVYVVLALLAIIQPLAGSGALATSPHLDLTRSVVGRNVLRHNILDREVMPRAAALANLARIVQDPGLMREALDHPDFDFIITHPRGRFLREPEIQQAILEGRWDFLVEDRRVFAMFEDIELVRAINRLRFDEDGRLLRAE